MSIQLDVLNQRKSFVKVEQKESGVYAAIAIITR